MKLLGLGGVTPEKNMLQLEWKTTEKCFSSHDCIKVFKTQKTAQK